MGHLARQGLHHHCCCHPPHATPLFETGCLGFWFLLLLLLLLAVVDIFSFFFPFLSDLLPFSLSFSSFKLSCGLWGPNFCAHHAVLLHLSFTFASFAPCAFTAYLHLFHTCPLPFCLAHAPISMSSFAGSCLAGPMLGFTRLVSKNADSSEHMSSKYIRVILRGTRGLEDEHLDIFC